MWARPSSQTLWKCNKHNNIRSNIKVTFTEAYHVFQLMVIFFYHQTNKIGMRTCLSCLYTDISINMQSIVKFIYQYTRLHIWNNKFAKLPPSHECTSPTHSVPLQTRCEACEVWLHLTVMRPPSCLITRPPAGGSISGQPVAETNQFFKKNVYI